MRAVIDFVLMVLRAILNVLGMRRAGAATLAKSSGVLKRGAKGPAVVNVQSLLKMRGLPIVVDGDYGKQTETAVRAFQKTAGLEVDGEVGPKTLAALEARKPSEPVKEPAPEPAPKPSGGASWYLRAKKYMGLTETTASFVRFLAPYWAKLDLPGYKKLAGSAYAWCGLFVAAMLIMTGHSYQKNGAGARNWAKYGQEIEWRKAGIPQGAIVHINHNQDCSSSEGNHVAFADGDCAPADLKSGAINLLGGNQSDRVKVSAFPVGEICHVRWPVGEKPPPAVTKSRGCSGSASGESTR